MKKPLNRTIKTWFGVGDFLFDFHSSFKTYYWSIFLTSIAALPLATVTALNTIVSTCEIVMSFFYGVIMDKMKPMRWGRYRSIVLVLAPATAIVSVLTWLVAGTVSSPTVVLVVLVILSLVYAVFFNLQYAANTTMVAVCGATEADRSFLSSRRWAWINADKVVLSAIATFLIARFSGIFGDSVVYPYILVAAVFAALLLIGQYIIFKITDGYEATAADMSASPAAKKAERVTFKVMLDTVIHNPPLLAMFCAQCCTTTVSFILAQMAAYQFNFALEAPKMLAFYLAATNFGAVLGSLAAGILGKKMEAKKLSMCCLPLCVIFLICARLFAGSVLLFTIFILLERTCSNCNYSTFVTMYSNCAIFAEYKNGVNTSGLVMSITNIPVKVAVLITGILIPAVLSFTGYDAAMTTVPEAVKSGLTNAITIIPAVCYCGAFLIVTFCFKLTGKEVARMQDEINARKTV